MSPSALMSVQGFLVRMSCHVVISAIKFRHVGLSISTMRTPHEKKVEKEQRWYREISTQAYHDNTASEHRAMSRPCRYFVVGTVTQVACIKC